MKYERSCGAVVYAKINGINQYVIIRQRDGSYGFPKGHMEEGETEQETALREIEEEVGLKVKLVGDFVRRDEYVLPRKKGYSKKVSYFLAEAETRKITIQQKELLFASFMSFEKAMQYLSFESTRQILTDAKAYLES